MIGIVIIAHGGLAKELGNAVIHVVGPQEQFEVVSMAPDDTAEGRTADLIAAVKKVDTGSGTAILTDLFGGTPSNLAISMMESHKVEVLAGANLPALIKLVEVRKQKPLQDCMRESVEAGRKYILNARDYLTNKL